MALLNIIHLANYINFKGKYNTTHLPYEEQRVSFYDVEYIGVS